MSDISRRRFFLTCASAAVIAQIDLSRPTYAAATGGFNKGKSQVQSWDLGWSGDFPFINLMKCASKWDYIDNQGEPNPTELDANGYPIKIVHGGVKCIVNIFPPSARKGIYVLTWTGNGTMVVGIPNSGTVNPSAGYSNASLKSRSGSGRFEFTTTSPDALVIGIAAIEKPGINDIKLFFKADEAALNNGQVFGELFLSVLRDGNPGVIRFLDWASTNTTNATTWATRKPVDYFSYSANEYRPGLYAGITRGSGIKYSATLDNTVLADKTTIHVTFNDNPISISIGPNAVVNWPKHGMLVGQPFMFTAPFGTFLPAPIQPSSYNGSHTLYWVTSTPTPDTFTFSAMKGGPNVDTSGGKLTGNPSAFATATAQNVKLSNANPAVVTWPDHGLSIGDAVSINSTQSYRMPAPLYNNRTYYVISSGFTNGSFQFSLTPEGPAISTAGSKQAGTIQAFTIPTLSLNGAAGIPILSPWGDPSSDNGAPFGGRLYATLVYDADLHGWLKFGGDGGGSVGLVNGVPLEIMVALCAEIGAHPHFCAPYLACDPMTDWHTQLATYVKNSGPSWMKPRFEGPNECWNPSYGFYSTRYAWNKSPAHWGASFSLSNHDWYGKVISTIGQDINSIYGGTPSSQTNYAVICAIQTVTAGSDANDPRLTSAQYVAQAAAPQTGYTKSAAYNWATHSCVANYWVPGERDTPTEIIDAFNYSVTNDGNPSGKLAIATAYINTANVNTTVGGSTAALFNLALTKGYATATKTWAAGIGAGQVSKMCGYEGGYSPDYTTNDGYWNNSVSAISQAENAVITVGAFNTNNQAGTGAAAVVGMPVRISGVNRMTQINNGNAAAVTVTAGSPGQIAYTAHGFSLGQAVYFSPSNFFGSQLPTGVIFGQAYYVRTTTTNNFTISATNGGAAIKMTGTQAQGVYCFPCWVVTGINTNAAGTITSFTVNANSVGFTPYANDGSGSITYGCSAYNTTVLRQAGKNVAAMQGYTTQLYNDFVAAGGEFPSCYMISGGGVIWSVWDPNIYVSTTPPQWAAIAAFNH